MKRKNKIFLFFGCIGLFLLITPVIIFYSQGYRFDFEKRKITQTGGFFFKIRPKKAKIYINDRFKEETDFLFGSVLIENLLPNTYKIRVEKEGFQKWEKQLKIEEKKVTEAKNILLFPENLSFEVLTTGSEFFFLSPDKSKIIFLEKEQISPAPPFNTSTPSQLKEKQDLKLYDLERKVKSHLLSIDEFHKKNIKILNIIWAFDSKKIIIETAIEEQVKYWLLKISPRVKLILLDFLPQNILNIDFSLKDSQKIFFTKSEKDNLNQLFEADLEKNLTSPLPFLENFIAFATKENKFYWLTQNGFVYESSFFNQRKVKVNQTPLPIPKGEIEIKILPKEENIFLQIDSELFWLNKKTKTFEKIFGNTSLIAFSPDHKKLAIVRKHEIWILFLEKEISQPPRKKGEKIFLTRFRKNIEKIFWINSHYLIFQVEDKIKVIEIDNREKSQIWELAKFQNSKIFFREKEKKLYVLSEGKLFSSKSLY